MRKVFLSVFIVLLIVLVGCGNTGNTPKEDNASNNNATGNNSGAQQEEKEIRLGHPFNENHSLHEAVVKFKETVESETDGSVKVTLFPNAILGSHADLYEGLQIGSVDMALIASTILASDYEPLNLFNLPYLFESREHAYETADGE